MPDQHKFIDEWLLRAVQDLPGVTPTVVAAARSTGERYLAQALIAAGLATRESVARALQSAYHIAWIDLEAAAVERTALPFIPEKLCRQHTVIPVSADNTEIIVAMANPLDQDAWADIQAAAGRRPVPQYCVRDRIERLITEFYSPDAIISDLLDQFQDDQATVEILEGMDPAAVESNAKDIRAPVIRLVNTIIVKAVKMLASDIHIEHEERNSAVRFRIDGVLCHIMTLPKSIAATAVVARIKIMADLDIADHRTPQDGRAKLRVGAADIGLRVSTLPTSFGEKVVMRILDKRSAEVPFDQLGFKPELAAKVQALLQTDRGIFLVTGPTGSGKTTTLYSIINNLRSEGTNIVTVEDPIEYKLIGINQVQVHEKAGLTFASVLRSVLRQDPDIILVGEIRDRETADIACQAALTGHLVLSTLHTNDTLSTITRLADIGLERFKIAPGLIAITAQRLVRKLCPACRVPDRRPHHPKASELLRSQGLTDTYFAPKGCAACGNSGFKGRIAILELLTVDAALKDLITSGAGDAALRQAALTSGSLYPLAADAAWHLFNGDVSFDEILPYLSLPEVQPAASAVIDQDFPAAPAALPTPPTPIKVKPRILVADDENGLRMLTRKVLESNGCEVEEAADGQEAMARLKSQTPDLLLLDLHMPRLDGYGVLRALRQTIGLTGLPVIILSSMSNASSQEEAFTCGADDYIIKPFDPVLLMARIHAVLRRQELTAPQIAARSKVVDVTGIEPATSSLRRKRSPS